MSIQVNGTEETKAALKEYADGVQFKAFVAINHAVDTCVSTAVSLAPYQTGYLREEIKGIFPNGISDRIEGLTEANAPYSLFVEEGHHTKSGSFVPAQPFLVPSFIKAGNQLIEDGSEAIK